GVLRFLADVVAIVDARNAERLEAEDRAYVAGDRLTRGKRDFLGFAIAQLFPFVERPMLGQIAVRGVMRRGLVGHERRAHLRAVRELQELRQELRRVAE